ncbi:uncharacterized protein [Argopecten irradians]|uniref:uncharacterized protein n=1 Tax=Argopecten irradians TaxID=31199 RepID=UPI00370F7875
MKVLWVIGCVCYVISLVGALPTPEETPKTPDALPSTVFNSELPVAAPATVEETITPVNGEGSVSAGETISAISDSNIDFPPLGETVKSDTDESPAPLPEAFNSPVPPVPLVPTALSQSNVGSEMLNNAILNANLNQQALNFNQQASNLNQQASNLNQQALTFNQQSPVGQLGKNGFLATVAGQRSIPTQMSRRLMFSAPSVRNTMQRNVNMISGPTPLATVRRLPIRSSSTIRPIQGSQRMALPSVIPISGSSPSFFSQTMNPPMPPANFPSSSISPNEPTFSMVPFVGPDFSSFSFPSSSFSSMPLSSIDPFPPTLEMQLTSVRPISAPQTVVFDNAQMSRRPLPPPTIQLQSAPASPPLNIQMPPPTTQVTSFQAPPTTQVTSFQAPPNTQVTSFQSLPPPMMSPSITPISTISTGPPLRSAPSSIPVPFVTTLTMMPTMPLLPGPRLTTFSSPIPQAGTNMIAGGLPTFQTGPNTMSGAIRPLPNMIAGGPMPLQTSLNMLPAGGPLPFQTGTNMLQAGGPVPFQTSPNMLPAGGPVPFQTGTNMIGGGMPQSFMQQAGGLGDGFGGFQSGQSFGGALGGDMFQDGMPPAGQPSLMSSLNSSLNDFFRPIMNAFRSM